MQAVPNVPRTWPQVTSILILWETNLKTFSRLFYVKKDIFFLSEIKIDDSSPESALTLRKRKPTW